MVMDARIILSYNKYRKHEIDTIVKFKYQRNSNFSVLIDSSAWIKSWESQDTTYPASAFETLPLDVDYIIKIPSVGKTFTFSNYQFTQQECGCEHKNYNMLSSFTLNGTVQHAIFVYYPDNGNFQENGIE